MYVGHKALMRTGFVKAFEADVDTGNIVHNDTT